MPYVSTWRGSGLGVGRSAVLGARRLIPLLVPDSGDEVVEDGEGEAVFEEEGVVEAGDGAGAPPFVVDAPAVLDARDGAGGAPTAALHQDGVIVVVGLDLDTDRRI
jgi:hypothetical protein